MIKDILIQGEKLKVSINGKYLDKDKTAVAIVGARLTTPKGRKLAYNFSYFLAQKGITIVSGLAKGIDTCAHEGALAAGGRTIAVLAHGLDMIYPPENYCLANKIVKSGCLLTKFKPGTKPLPENFLARNQIIAGLSKAILVIEGQRRSGSISTANWGANLGIEVFAIAGSPATDWLIENGANVVTKPESIINYLKVI